MRQHRLDILLSIDGDIDYDASAGAFRNDIAQLAECAYIPNLKACEALLALQLEILADEAEIVIGRVIPALAEFYLRITIEQVEELDRQVRQFIDNLVRVVEEVAALVNELLAAAENLRLFAEEQAQQAQAILAGIRAQLTDSDHRQAIRDRLRQQGIDNVLAATAGADETVRAGALWAFLVAFDNPVTQALLDAALATIGNVAGDLGGVLQGAHDDAEAASRLGDALVAKAVAAIPGEQFIDGSLTASDVGHAIKQVLVTTYLKQQIGDWLTAIDAEQAARALEDAKRLEAEQERVRLKDQERRLGDNRLAGPVDIRVLSPSEMGKSLHQGWVYPAEVPVTIVLSGAVSRGSSM